MTPSTGVFAMITSGPPGDRGEPFEGHKDVAVSCEMLVGVFLNHFQVTVASLSGFFRFTFCVGDWGHGWWSTQPLSSGGWSWGLLLCCFVLCACLFVRLFVCLLE